MPSVGSMAGQPVVCLVGWQVWLAARSCRGGAALVFPRELLTESLRPWQAQWLLPKTLFTVGFVLGGAGRRIADRATHGLSL
jgi:hypothetical protein